ncbi:E3 ubiquitin-protein ligase tom1, partial [Spiromyces aspiralis]
NVRHIDHQIVNDLLPVSIEQRILRRRIVKEEARRIEEERKRKEEQEAEERHRREEEEAKTREKEERKRPAESTNAEQNEPMLIEDETVEAGPTRPSEPIIVRIGGEDVDIAGTGIDPEVLRELPEDIREEVYHQHLESINQSRSQATRQDDISGSGISREFLDALPDDIREEVLQQERLERIMRERQQQQQQASSSQAAAAGSGAAESPQAAQQSPRTSVSNIDRTAPQFTQQLPPLFSFSTLSGGISGEQPNPFSRLFGSWQPRTTPAPLGSSPYAGTQADGGGGGGGLVQRPPNVVGGRLRGPMDQQRPTVIFQLIDRTELAMVVRHLFLPNEEINITLYKTILQLLCLNPRTRLDLIFIMLALLQSNAMTFDALDSVIYQVMKSSMPGPSDHQQPSSSLFLKSPTSKISIIPKEPEAPAKGSSEGTRTEFVRPLPSILQVSPAATMPSRAHILKHVYPLAMLNYEVPIYYIATGAMNTLLFLVTKIPKAAGHFLVEQPSMAVAVADLLSSPALSRKLGRHASAKGKESAATPARGKDKLPAVTREVSKYPVVALLELLNNSQVYLEHSEPMEILVELLASVTKPLVVWSKKLTGEANKSKVAADTVSSATVTNEGNSGVGNAGEPSAAASSSSQPPSSDSGTVTASPKLPQIPEPALRTLANVLTADECSSKTFRNFLTLIGNFSVIPGVNDLVTEELLHRVSSLSVEVQQDLQQLLPLLQTS